MEQPPGRGPPTGIRISLIYWLFRKVHTMKRKSTYKSLAFLPLGTLCILIVLLTCKTAIASPPNYGTGKPTTDKVRYCQKLVNRFGHQSQIINDDYYGVGVSKPHPKNWSLRTKEPGWFSSDLYIIFEQTTNERYEDFTHTASCHWDKHSFFIFQILHHTYGGVCPSSGFLAPIGA